MTPEEKLQKARAVIVMDEPFFAAILLRRKLQPINQGTFAVDARGQIYYNPKFVEPLSVAQCVFALVHEVFHVVKMDFIRRGARAPRKWNMAGDAWINNYLLVNRIGEPIEGCINCNGGTHIDADIKADTTETIYERVPEDDGSGYGNGAGGYGIGDDFMDGDGDLSEAERSEIEAKTKVEIAQAAQAAKMQGKMPGNLQRIIDEVLYVRTPWEDILERFMNDVAQSETTWKRPHKKYAPLGFYLPSVQSENALGEIALLIDMSGSIGDKELQFFAGHLNRIMETCKPTKVHVVYCDERVNHVDEFGEEDYPVKLTPYGGGGTDLRRGFDYVRDNCENLSCFIVFTDCYTPWPDPKEVEAPTLVLSTTQETSPFETVFFEVE